MSGTVGTPSNQVAEAQRFATQEAVQAHLRFDRALTDFGHSMRALMSILEASDQGREFYNLLRARGLELQNASMDFGAAHRTCVLIGADTAEIEEWSKSMFAWASPKAPA